MPRISSLFTAYAKDFATMPVNMTRASFGIAPFKKVSDRRIMGTMLAGLFHTVGAGGAVTGGLIGGPFGAAAGYMLATNVAVGGAMVLTSSYSAGALPGEKGLMKPMTGFLPRTMALLHNAPK